MNVWQAIKDKVERETGYQVVSLDDNQDTINTKQIILIIEKIEKTSYENTYQVSGSFAVKYGQGWPIVTDLLDLELTGTRAVSEMTSYSNGFIAMSIEFVILAKKEKDRTFTIKEVNYD